MAGVVVSTTHISVLDYMSVCLSYSGTVNVYIIYEFKLTIWYLTTRKICNFITVVTCLTARFVFSVVLLFLKKNKKKIGHISRVLLSFFLFFASCDVFIFHLSFSHLSFVAGCAKRMSRSW